MKFEQTQEYLLLPKGIALNKNERQEMNRIFESALKEIYNVRKFFQGIVTIEGIDVRYEYISKALNNRTLLKKIIFDQRKEIVTNVSTKEELFEFVKENIHDLLHPTGRYFPAVYSLLQATSSKGDKSEILAFNYIQEMGKKKGLNLQVLKPREIKEDVYGGVDGFFVYNDREFTVQIKPLSEKISPYVSEYRKDPKYYIAYVDGFIKEIYTDYLALVDEKTNTCLLYKAKNIITSNAYYLIPKENLVEI